MRSHRYRNPRIVLPRVDHGRPAGAAMQPMSPAAVERLEQNLARWRVLADDDAQAPTDEVPCHES